MTDLHVALGELKIMPRQQQQYDMPSIKEDVIDLLEKRQVLVGWVVKGAEIPEGAYAVYPRLSDPVHPNSCNDVRVVKLNPCLITREMTRYGIREHMRREKSSCHRNSVCCPQSIKQCIRESRYARIVPGINPALNIF